MLALDQSGPMTRPDAPLATRELAGYRVLRSLARDEQAEVLLGHRVVAGDDGDTESAETVVSETVAIKVSPATPEGWQEVLRLTTALDRARGDHVVELRDADADDATVRLVFERLTRGDLASLLGIRAAWEAGEAVTVLAPIVTTVQRLHAAGLAHGALSPHSVMFRDDGAPTLIGFSSAELFEPGAPEVVLERVPAVVHDRSAVRRLAVLVLERVAGSRARAARELLAQLAASDDEALLPLLASRLFAVAAALPVRFTADEPEPDAASSGSRIVPVSSDSWGDRDGGAEPDARAGAGGALAVTLARLVPEPLVQRVLDATERSPAAPVARAIGRRWRSWSAPRRRIALAAGAAAVTIAVVTAVIPATRVTSSADPASLPTPPESAAADSAPSRAGAPILTGDDPVAAASALVGARDRCLISLSLPCLDGVDEAGSGALADDQATVRAAARGGELPDPAVSSAGSGSPVLIERLGDSALVRLGGAASAPASLLLVKGEAGWRIRDVIAGAPE
jgi:tRNA A-37 threonylcarbamoyl transferase component Bud32